MRNSKSVRTIAVSGAALLALAACGGGDEGGTSAEGGGSEEKQINVYGTDGNMQNSYADELKDWYRLEREQEVRALCDARVGEAVASLGLELCTFGAIRPVLAGLGT